MGLLTEMKWPQTTLLDVLNDADLLDVDLFDVVHLELNSGRDYVVAVITGEKAVEAAELLERLRTKATVSQALFEDGCKVIPAHHLDALTTRRGLQAAHRVQQRAQQISDCSAAHSPDPRGNGEPGQDQSRGFEPVHSVSIP
ncbi:hypothetical protein [Pseudomonas aeruginosa]|uniref:hypothetical protein n=1 Tax=Pseudomonas aeruginosa TaxID=287 RepID=UPI00163BD67C|nr:hypothetical protein [Pseudomonas aeruginosa]